jgi:hypothetical protein
MDEEQYDEEQQNIEPFDSSQYSNAVDPNTGFTTWSKDNKQLTNIKKQDPELWEQLKEEGKGARFRTGQTDIQKFGRTAGKIANTMQTGVELAGTIGNVLNERNRKRNMDAAAMNMGSTAAMFTNPQGSSKGDYGVTGSTYGAFKPYNTGTFSYKGMYGKYGMEVPSYQVGGYTPDLATLSEYGIEKKPKELEVEFRDFSNITTPFIPSSPVVSLKDYVRILQNAQPNYEIPKQENIDVDLALQAVAGIESSSAPGETALGKRTNLVGKGGKRASAIGTYQMTDDTIKEAYKNPQIKKQYSTFNEFKNAVKTDANAEYIAAKTIMQQHIKNYGPYSLGAWYYPEFARKAAAGDKSVFDIVPRRDFGNSVKWGDDFNKKLKAYNKLAGTNYTPTTVFNAPLPVAQKKYTTPAGENPMARKTFKDFQTEFSGITNMGIWGDKRHREENPSSDHNTADALDIGVQNIDQGNKVAEKLIREAKDRNIKYIIFNNRIWNAKTNTWSAYTGDNPHKTHVHTSFNRVKKQLGGQVVEMDEDQIQQFLKAGGQLEFLD